MSEEPRDLHRGLKHFAKAGLRGTKSERSGIISFTYTCTSLKKTPFQFNVDDGHC
jgi:hypothetical protein